MIDDIDSRRRVETERKKERTNLIQTLSTQKRD